MLFYFNAKWYCKHSVVSRWKNLTGPWSIYGLQCTALCSRMNCKQIHHTLVPRQTFVLTQDYEWESRELNLTVPKTPSVADTGMWPLPLLSFSRHPQALHNCLSASDESREQLGKTDKPHALSAWLRELTFILWKWDSFNLAKQ